MPGIFKIFLALSQPGIHLETDWKSLGLSAEKHEEYMMLSSHFPGLDNKCKMVHFPVVLGILQKSSESSPHFHIIFLGYSIPFPSLENDWKASYIPHVFPLIIQGFSKRFSGYIPGWKSARKILNIPGNFQTRIIAGKSTPFQLFSIQLSQWENFALPAVPR